MSFILDALKKSEVERQRQTMPGLMDTPSAARRSRLPLWAVLLGVLLAVNVAVLIVILMRNGAAAPAANLKKHADAAPVAEQPPAAAEHFSPLGPAPVYAPEIPAAIDVPHPIAQRSAPRSAQHRADPVLINEDAQEDNGEVLPTISEINLTGSQALPELHLDVHVYATKPADRFVYINMRKYHEGTTLPEGPVIERIRRDGVVLSYRGLRFMLPRQS
jgi:general secretion pathway protein B